MHCSLVRARTYKNALFGLYSEKDMVIVIVLLDCIGV